MRDEETADLQRDASSAAAGEKGHDDHAVRHELRGDGEEPDHGLLPTLVLMGGVAEGNEESGEEGEVGAINKRRVAPGDFVESLSRLASLLFSKSCTTKMREKGEKM